MASLGGDVVNLYVTDNQGTIGSPGTFVSIVDANTNTVIGYVDSNGFDLTHPIDVHFNSNDTLAYVTCDTVNAVYVINVSLQQVVGKVDDLLNPFNAPSSMDLNLNVIPNIAYVANEAGSTGNQGSINIIDMSVNVVTGKVDDTLGPVNLPIGIGISDDGTQLLVANFNGANVSIVDTATNTATGYVNDVVNPFVRPLLVGWSGSTKAYISDLNTGPGSGFVNVVVGGAVTGTVDTTGFPAFSQPVNIYEGPDGMIYITDNLNNNIYEVNHLTDKVIHVFTGTFSAPLGIVVTLDNTTAYVANSGNNTVSIVDVATRMQTGVINVSGFPFFVPYQLALASTTTPPPPFSTPLRPICINGKQKINRFATQSELYNTISWCSSPSLGAVKYHLYRNGVLIKTINANDELTFVEHDVTEDIVYSVTAVSALGVESPAVTISLPQD
jgi:YVTN family beta-propeller protein